MEKKNELQGDNRQGREKEAEDMALEDRKTTADEGPSRGERIKIEN